MSHTQQQMVSVLLCEVEEKNRHEWIESEEQAVRNIFVRATLWRLHYPRPSGFVSSVISSLHLFRCQETFVSSTVQSPNSLSALVSTDSTNGCWTALHAHFPELALIPSFSSSLFDQDMHWQWNCVHPQLLSHQDRTERVPFLCGLFSLLLCLFVIMFFSAWQSFPSVVGDNRFDSALSLLLHTAENGWVDAEGRRGSKQRFVCLSVCLSLTFSYLLDSVIMNGLRGEVETERQDMIKAKVCLSLFSCMLVAMSVCLFLSQVMTNMSSMHQWAHADVERNDLSLDSQINESITDRSELVDVNTVSLSLCLFVCLFV